MKFIGSIAKHSPDWAKDLMLSAVIIFCAALFVKKNSFAESANLVLTIYCGFALAVNIYRYGAILKQTIKTRIIPEVTGKLVYCAISTVLITLLFFFYFNEIGKMHVLLVALFDMTILLVNANLLGI